MIYQIAIIISLGLIIAILARRLPDTAVHEESRHPLPEPNQSRKIGDPVLGSAPLRLADRFFAERKFESAEAEYLKASAYDPNNPKIYNRLGIIYLEEENFEAAKKAFQKALAFDDKVPSRHANLGIAYLALKNFDSAIGCFEKALSYDPMNSHYQSMIIEVKNKKSDFEAQKLEQQLQTEQPPSQNPPNIPS